MGQAEWFALFIMPSGTPVSGLQNARSGLPESVRRRRLRRGIFSDKRDDSAQKWGSANPLHVDE